MAPDYLDEFDRQGQRNAGSCRSSPPASAFSSSGAASASTPPTGRWPPPRSTSSPRSSPFEQSSSGALAPPRDSSRRPPGRSARHLQQDLDDVAEGKQIGDGFDERQVPLGDDALPSPSEPRSFVSVKVRHGNLRNIRWQTISQAAGLDSTRPCNHILGLDVGGNLATSLTGAECYPWLLSLNLSQNDVRTLSAPRLPFMLTHLDLSHNVLKSLEGLQELPYLKWLNVGHNYIEDVVALSGSFRLRELRLGNNNIADLEGLEGLHDLEYLGLEHNQVSKESEIRTLSPLRSLRSLCLTGNPIDARRKGLRVICMGILPGLMSLDGVKISRVASVRRVPANRYASPGKGKASSPSDHNSPAPDMILNPLFSLKPADEGLQVNASQARERQCSLSVVGQATVQHLEALLQDAAQAHGLQWVMRSSAPIELPVDCFLSAAVAAREAAEGNEAQETQICWRAKAAEMAHVRRQQSAKSLREADKEYENALQRHGLRTMPYVPERAPHEIWGMCGVHEDGDRRELGADSVYFPGMFVPPKGGISDDQLMKSLLGKSLQRKGKAHHLAKEPKPIRSAPMVVPGWTGLERSASASPSTQVYSSRPGADLTKQPPGEEGPRRSGDAMRHAAPVANTASIFHAETAAAGQTRPADAETLLSQVRAVKEALELETAARLGIDRPPYTFQPAAPGIWSSNELPGNALPDEGSGTPGAPMSAAPGMDVVGTSPMSGPPAQPSLQVHRGPETSGPKEPARLRFEHARASPEPQLKGVGAQAPPVTRQGRGGGAVEAAPAFEKGNGFRSSPTSRGGSRACPSLAHAALSHEKDEIMELASAVQHVYVRLDDLARQKDRVASPADVLGQPAKSHGVSAADAMLELLKTAGDRKKAYLAELAGLDSPARSTP